MRNLIFIDRDGTIIKEPEDYQIDSLEKLELVDGAIPAMLSLQSLGYELILVSNQDGLGTSSFPQDDFDIPHAKLLQILNSQGVRFVDELICPHMPDAGCKCRKPKPGLLKAYLGRFSVDNSYVIGDRDSDIELADNIGVKGFKIGDSLTWDKIVQEIAGRKREASVQRNTKETKIDIAVDLDAKGNDLSTGIGFFDHMLDQLSTHGGFYLRCVVKGDLDVDEHHTVEDTAIAIGQALHTALGTKAGIGRFAFLLPMDETECQVALDLSGRAFFKFNGQFSREKVGELSTEMVQHFFRSLAESLRASLHITVTGENAHHQVESCFKCVGRCLRDAFKISGSGIPSTKGTL